MSKTTSPRIVLWALLLQTYPGGIQYMTELPEIVIIVERQEEHTALRECITLGIPTVCLIDTNCDPGLDLDRLE